MCSSLSGAKRKGVGVGGGRGGGKQNQEERMPESFPRGGNEATEPEPDYSGFQVRNF